MAWPKVCPRLSVGAQPGFTFIPGYDSCLVAAGNLNCMGKTGRVPLDEPFHIVFQPAEEWGITDEPVLDNLGHPGAKPHAPARTRAHPYRRAPRQVGEMRRSYFFQCVVHRRLAAHGGIDLGQ